MSLQGLVLPEAADVSLINTVIDKGISRAQQQRQFDAQLAMHREDRENQRRQQRRNDQLTAYKTYATQAEQGKYSPELYEKYVTKGFQELSKLIEVDADPTAIYKHGM